MELRCDYVDKYAFLSVLSMKGASHRRIYDVKDTGALLKPVSGDLNRIYSKALHKIIHRADSIFAQTDRTCMGVFKRLFRIACSTQHMCDPWLMKCPGDDKLRQGECVL